MSGGERPRKVLVVLGAGRSGTSLLMQVLHTCGMRVSQHLTPKTEFNPEGGWEDREIFDAQRDLMRDLNTNHYLPMPTSWLDAPATQKCISTLVPIVEKNVQSDHNIWGFKDPKTALLIPMWSLVFEICNVQPFYLLAVRNPTAVINSMVQNYGTDPRQAETFWLLKYTFAITDLAGSVCIVHYEDWFKNPLPQARTVLRYAGLHLSDDELRQRLPRTVKDHLNRAETGSSWTANPDINDLYSVLRSCTSASFDKDALLLVAHRCRNVVERYTGLAVVAQEAMKKYNTVVDDKNKELSLLKKKLRQSRVRLKEKNRLIAGLRSQIEERNQRT